MRCTNDVAGPRVRVARGMAALAMVALLDGGFDLAWGGNPVLAFLAIVTAAAMDFRNAPNRLLMIAIACGGLLTARHGPEVLLLAAAMTSWAVAIELGVAAILVTSVALLASILGLEGWLMTRHVTLSATPVAVITALPLGSLFLAAYIGISRGWRAWTALLAWAAIGSSVFVACSVPSLEQRPLACDVARCLMICVFVVVDSRRGPARQSAVSKRAWSRAIPTGTAIGMIALIGFDSWRQWSETQVRSAVSRVVVLDECGGDWKRPEHGQYGAYSGGMYGLLPEYGRADGVRIERLRLDSGRQLTLEDVKGADVLMLLNCGRHWRPAELEVLDAYMLSGGCVTAVVDHTDAFGAGAGLNRMLRPYGSHVRMDSAYPRAGSWRGDLLPTRTGRLLWGPRAWSHDLGWSIGASIEADSTWHAIAYGRWAFSDAGDYSNIPGNRLGDYKHAAGESAGGLVVAAMRPVGHGGIAVFADSGFVQNGTCLHEWRDLTLPVLRDVPTVLRIVDFRFKWAECLLMLVLLVMLLDTPGSTTIGAAATCLACLGILSAAAPRGQVPEPMPLDTEFVANLEGIAVRRGHYRLHMFGDGALRSAVSRTGRRVLDVAAEDEEWRNARFVFLVSPCETLCEQIVRRLVSFVERGGRVLVVASGAEATCASPLLEKLGLTGGDPIAVIADPARSGARFVSPGRVVANGDCDVEAWIGEWPVVVKKRLSGGGRVVWICDSRFLVDSNTEGVSGVIYANVFLLRDIVGWLCSE